MKFIEWCNLFYIGHPVIDEQHQSLIDISNAFHDEMINGFNRGQIFETLNQLITYAENHFSTEEDLMEKLCFPQNLLAVHKEKHEQLVLDIFSLNEELMNGKIKTMGEIEKFLVNWLVLHILIEDIKIKDHLNEASI